MIRRRGTIFWLLAGCLVAGVVYYSYDPGRTPWFPRCPLLVLTGLKCPGCGSQRAIHSLLHGDLVAAIQHNALLVLSLPLIFLLLYAEWQRKHKPQLYIHLQRTRYILAYLALIILWSIARNLFGW